MHLRTVVPRTCFMKTAFSFCSVPNVYSHRGVHSAPGIDREMAPMPYRSAVPLTVESERTRPREQPSSNIIVR